MSKTLNLVLLALGGIFTLSILFKPKNGVDVIEPFDVKNYQQGTTSTDWVIVHSGNDRFGKLYEIYQRERTTWPSARQQYDYGVRPTTYSEWACTENGGSPTRFSRIYDSLDSAMKAFNLKIGAVVRGQLDVASSANQLTGAMNNSYGVSAGTGGWGNSGR